MFGCRLLELCYNLIPITYNLIRMSLTQEQLQHIAMLARLKLTPEDAERFQHQVSDILDFVEQLQEVDTAGVEPLHQVGEQTLVWRDDAVVGCNDRELLLDSAAERQGDLIKTQAIFNKK